ncbi:MAG: prepilin-type N-terminal cleavage/methylation domain-containing protein [Pseudomonadota bacterium]
MFISRPGRSKTMNIIYSKQFAFSLVELLMTIAIVGIVSSIAYVSYSEQVKKVRLAELKEDLSTVITSVEQEFFTRNKLPDTNEISLPTNDYFNLNYKNDIESNSYVISGSGKPGTNLNKVWAAANGKVIRCFCSECVEIPALTSNATTCPAGTMSW